MADDFELNLSEHIDEGGFVFPVVAANGLGHMSSGMTQRDYIALHASVHDVELVRQWFMQHKGVQVGQIAARFIYADEFIRSRIMPLPSVSNEETEQ